jgi:hypothetical protein
VFQNLSSSSSSSSSFKRLSATMHVFVAIYYLTSYNKQAGLEIAIRNVRKTDIS